MDTARTYLPGPSVCGFYGAFERDYGELTPEPYARVTPSRVGSALLPFNCPGCDEVIDFSDAEKRENYHDTREIEAGKKRDNYWCPSCGTRFKLNLKGKPFKGEIDETHAAPSEVETIAVGDDGMLDYKRTTKIPKNFSMLFRHYVTGTDILGAC